MNGPAQIGAISAVELYRRMLRIRMVEERIATVYSEQEMRCPVHLCIGQEAIAVGVCAALGPGDYALSNHRSHGHYLAKGGDLKAMMAELYGRATGCSQGKGGSMHLVDVETGFLGAAPIVGSTIAIANGVALGSRMRGSAAVTVAFFGDGATEEGVFHEALDFAALKTLPIMFVCENNLYSVYSPLAVRQAPARRLVDLAASHGVWASAGDGNDVQEVQALAQLAAGRARAGEGPAFLELATYRWREHCGPEYDNSLGYRSAAEFEEWRRRCPLQTMCARLLERGIAYQEELAAMAHAIGVEIDAAFEFARTSPFPGPELMLQDVYAC